MRILLIAPQPFFTLRGTPIAVRELLEVLRQRGDRVDVLTYFEGEEPRVPGVTVHRIPRLPWCGAAPPGFSLRKLLCDMALLGRCVSLLRRTRFDLIHAVEESAFIALAMKVIFGVPFVYDMDSSLVQQLIEKYAPLRALRAPMEWLEKRAVRGSLGVVAVCRVLEDLARRYAPGQLVARVEDVSLLCGGDAAGSESLAATIGRDGPIVLYVGNLETYQGIDLLIAGFARALPSVPDAQLVLIGGDERSRRRYAGAARRLGIAAHVHLIGPRPLIGLGAYLRQADVLVSPRTRGVNTPMKIYSYLDSGRPLLATRLPTHTQVLDDGVALLVAPDPGAFGEGLERLLRDPALRRRLADGARRRARAEFSREAMRGKLGRFYEALERRMAAAG